MIVVPVTRDQAQAFVAAHHRHNRRPIGWLFGAGVAGSDGELRGVVMVGRPISRHLADGYTVEILRVCTLGDRNAPTMLYGAACRAARALGYRLAITYTLRSEPGTSLRAAGFELVAAVEERDTWARPKRGRQDVTLWGVTTLPAEPRDRWHREL